MVYVFAYLIVANRGTPVAGLDAQGR